MSILKTIFTILENREEWVELETLYSVQRMENICNHLADRNVPYKIRAAMLSSQMNAAAPMGTMVQPMWYLSVHPDDVGKVHHYLRTEKMD